MDIVGWGGGWVRAAGDGARGLNNLNRDRGEEGDSGRARGRTRGGSGVGSREGGPGRAQDLNYLNYIK